MLYANPGDVDWFDDAGWGEVVNHWRVLARLAKQGGLRGLLFDAEPYVNPHSQFRYDAQPESAKHTFDEYRTKARQRGCEVMRALADEFPDATIFTYRLFSDLLPLLDAGNLNRTLEPDTYGLQPAFVDGWMDAAPATITFIEGTEDIGYRANSPAEYNAAFTRQRLRLAEFLRRSIAKPLHANCASARAFTSTPTSIHPATPGPLTARTRPPPDDWRPISPPRWRRVTASCGCMANRPAGGRAAMRIRKPGRRGCPER